MTGRLLDRQARLLEYLTSGGAIFGGRRGEAIDPALSGIDRGLLGLEARFSHEKRMEKVAGVFPATFALLDADMERVVREFAEMCPPHDITRIDNARQFHGFLVRRGTRNSNLPPHLLDVAACEMACADARVRADAGALPEHDEPDAPRPAIRRNRRVVLLRTAFDIRKVFEGEASQVPAKRDTRLAVIWRAGEPEILELTSEVFEVLTALNQWVALGDFQGADELAAELARSGLLELRR
jgi:hypothetical protein